MQFYIGMELMIWRCNMYRCGITFDIWGIEWGIGTKIAIFFYLYVVFNNEWKLIWKILPIPHTGYIIKLSMN